MSRRDRYQTGYDRPRGGARGALGLIGVVIWTVIIWAAYALVGVVTGLVSSNSAWLATTFTSLAASVGLGKLAETLNPAWWIETALWLANALLLPATLIVWLIGAVLIALAPKLIGVLRDLRGSSGYDRRYRD